MNAETAQCDQPTIKKKCGKHDAFMANEYVSMNDECSDVGENSDDLFSDCEERKDTTYYSPNVSHVTNSTLSNLSASSLLHCNQQYGTPAAVVPSTPLSLLPFLSKVSEQWTSDLETPQADRTVCPYINRSATSMGSGEKGSTHKQCTPPLLNMNNKETHCITASPVITCKQKRNRTKRRIFRSAIVSPSGTTLPNVVECAKHTEPQTEVLMEQIECENIKEKLIPCLQKMVVCKDNVVNARINTCLSRNSVSKISNTSPIVNNHNTSTQDFFTNASFTDVDKLCENNLTEGNANIIQICEKINSKNCEAGQQKTVPSAKCKNSGKQSEIENILKKVNECKRLVQDYMVDKRDKGVKINTKNETGKDQNDETSVKAIDIHFNTSIDTQDWFINESALHEAKDLCAIKSKSTDDAGIHGLKEDKGEQQQKRFIQNEVVCDNIVNSDCTKKQQNVTLPSKRATCAESDFDEFLKKLDRNEYEKPFLGFTTEEKFTAETKSLSTVKLIGNLETSGLIKQAVNNETFMIQNDNSSTLSTASGKSALLRNKALTNPKIFNKNKLLDNSKEAGLFTQPQTNNSNHAKDNKSSGFSTASGKSIALSENALLTAKTLFADELLDDVRGSNVPQQFEITKEVAHSFRGSYFSTASGKSIKLSDEALTKANAFLADEFTSEAEIPQPCLEPQKLKKFEQKTDNSCYFSTANGKPLALSDKALSKAMALFADDTLNYNEDLEMPVQSNKDQQVNRSNFQNFTTAKGQPMTISPEALSKAKALFEVEFGETTAQIQFGNKLSNSNEKSEFSVRKPVGKPHVIKHNDTCGFSTASGKSIALSDKALSKANALFAEDTLDNNKDFEMFAQSFKKQKMNHKNSLNFTTPKDHPIKEEQKASSRALSLFADEHEETAAQTLCANKSTSNNERSEFSVQKPMSKPNMKIEDACGFSTASGKSIALSEKALSEAKALFAHDSVDDDEDLELFAQSFEKQKMNKICTPKITTAKGRAMTISDKALSKAKCLFADDLKQTTEQTPFLNHLTNSNERCESSVEKPIDKPNVMQNDDTCGFSTASGKYIALSDKALSKAKSLFADDFLSDNENSETLIQLQGESMGKKKNLVGLNATNGDIKVSQGVTSLARNVFNDKRNALPENNQFDIVDGSAKENEQSILFSTANGKPVNVSEKAIQKAQELLLNDVDDTSEKQGFAKNILGEELSNISNSVYPKNTGIKMVLSNNTPNNDEFQSVQKRKISNSDDDTPLGRHATSTFKKPRFSDDRQGRKLVFDDLNTDKEIKKQLTQSVDINFGCEPLQVLDEQNTKRYKVARSLSDEIAASASALLADETDENNLKNHTSKDKATEKSLVTLFSSTSPVLGRPAFPQRRSKRKTIGCSSTNVPDVEQNVAAGKKKGRLSDSVFCTKIPQSDETTKTLENRADLDGLKANDFVDTQLIMDYIDKTTDISEKRLAAALEQDKIIQAKKRNKPKRTMSTLLLYKETNKNKRISWRKLTNGAAPILYSYKEANERNISPEILNMTTNSATTYRFRCSDFYGDNDIETNVNGLEMVDGARLILDENGYVGLPEISRAFLASSGVDPALVPVGWIKNHYCWIVWKLASMDRVKFTSVSLPRALTPARVMEQLKYRYDREIDKSQRPALRRILEKDDAGSKRMILCVSSLVECKNADVVGKSPSIAIASSWKMVLTDGWYSVPACIDLAMINNIISGKVKKGTKLLICGAELLNSDQGCSPLEIPGDICLKIHTNSTRRAKWYAKMGFSSCPGPIPVKLQSVCPHGGLIGKMVVTIVRVYPLLYHEKTTSGESIFRNARCEEKANLAYEQECRSKMEALYAKTEKYFSNGKKSLSTDTDTDSMDFLAAELSEQCQNLSEEEFMSKQQQESLLNKCRMKEEEFKQKLESKLRENLPPQRKVSPVLKLRVADEKKCAILTVWSPSDDVMDILKEGNRVLMCGVSASGKRADELQLTAGRNTVFKLESKSGTSYPNRICTPLCSIADPAFNPTYGEIDTVGLIVSIQNGPYGMKNFEAVNLTYQRKNSSEYSYLSILFWQSIATYGYKEILTVGSFVACSNLEWRRATTASIPLVYCTERTTFTRNPRQAYLQSAVDELKASIGDPDECIAYCTDEISAELQKKLIAKSPGYITPNKLLPTIAPQKSTGQNLGLANSSIVNPRSSSVQKRLEKLKWYGEPSELPPIIVNTRSTRISLDFRSPVANRKVTPTRPP